MNGTLPFSVYPRPQLKRSSYFCLNGAWDFTVFHAEKRGKSAPDPRKEHFTITVPYCPESALSGVQRTFTDDDTFLYTKTFTLPPGFTVPGGRIILHFGAVDQVAEVRLNGAFAGRHAGGYTHFSLDVTEAILPDGENRLELSVTDRLDDCIYPYGKQKHKRGGMWYTPVTGIWQTVWLEAVPETYIKRLAIETAGKTAVVKIHAVQGKDPLPVPDGAFLSYRGKTIPFNAEKAVIQDDSADFWTPEHPVLYDFTVTLGADRVDSYLGFRDSATGTDQGIPRLFLNGAPYYYHGVLDQGYYPGGLFTPASENAYENDLRFLKAAGFNMLRKHIKVEPDLFYYACDRLGIAVFQDMVENGAYRFLRDTIFPTVFGKKKKDKNLHKNADSRAAFLQCMEETVAQLQNHPSIVYWTIFNEGWGQFDSENVYEALKKLDKTRVIDTASGWFQGGKSDVISEHVYFKDVKMRTGSSPFVLSEYGGYAWKVRGHAFNEGSQYGYRSFSGIEAYEAATVKLFQDVSLLIPKGLSADVYTQLSDVEDELNGLRTYDRSVEKIPPAVLRAAFDAAKINQNR